MADSREVRLRFLVETVDRASKQLEEVSASLKGISKEAGEAGKKTQETGKKTQDSMAGAARTTDDLNKKIDALSKTSQVFSDIGIRLVAVGAALTGIAAVAIKVGADFERGMSRVLAVSDDAQENILGLRETAISLGTAMIFSARQVTEGLEILTKAGLTATQAMAAIRPVLDLATAGAIGMGEAADVTIGAMSGFNLSVRDLTHVTDVFAKTANETIADVMDVGEALKYVAAVAASTGVGLDETAAAIGVMSQAGIKGTMAGTELRQILLGLTNITPAAQQVFDDMGVTIAKNADGTIRLTETLKALRDANLSTEQAGKIFQARAAAGALVLTNNISLLEKLTDSNLNAEGSTKKMAETMQKNLGGAMIRLQNTIQALAITMSGPLLDPLREFISIVADGVASITRFAAAHQVLAGAVIGLGGVLGLLTGGMGLLLLSVAGAIKAWSLWLRLMRDTKTLIIVGTLIEKVSLATFTLTGAVNALRKAWLVLSTAILANPILALGTAIVTTAIAIQGMTRNLEEQEKTTLKYRSTVEEAASSLNRLKNAMGDAEVGSEEAKKANLAFRAELVKVSEENEKLSLSALRAANSISLMSGNVEDGSKAIQVFLEVLRIERLDAIAKHVKAVGDVFEDAFDPGLEGRIRGLVSEFGRMEGTIKNQTGFIDSMRFSLNSLLGTIAEVPVAFFKWDFSGVGKTVEEESEKLFGPAIAKLDVATEKMKKTAAAAIKDWIQTGAVGYDFNVEQLAAYLKQIGIKSEQQVQIFSSAFLKIRSEHERSLKERVRLSATAEAQIAENLGDAVEKQINEVSRLTDAYKRAKAAFDISAAPTDLGEVQKATADLNTAMEDLTRTQTRYTKAAESAFGAVKQKQVKDTAKLVAQGAVDEDTARIKNLQGEVLFAQSVLSLRRQLTEQSSRLGEKGTELYLKNKKEEEAASTNLASKQEALDTATIARANKTNSQLQSIYEATAKMRIDLLTDERKKIEEQERSEIDLFKKGEDYKLLVRIDKEGEIQKRLQAIQSKYSKQRADYEKKLTDAEAEARLGILDATRAVEEARLKTAYDNRLIDVDTFYTRQLQIAEDRTKEMLDNIDRLLAVAEAEKRWEVVIQLKAERGKALAELDKIRVENRAAEENDFKARMQEQRNFDTQLLELQIQSVENTGANDKKRHDLEMQLFDRTTADLMAAAFARENRLEDLYKVRDARQKVRDAQNLQFQQEQNTKLLELDNELRSQQMATLEGNMENLRRVQELQLDQFDRNTAVLIQSLRDKYGEVDEIDAILQERILQRAKLAHEQQLALWEARLSFAQDTAVQISSAFETLYDMSGKKSRELFFLAKAAAIAEATVNTALAVTKALAQGGIWGQVLAGAIAAAGGVQVAKIMSTNMQGFAEGGQIKGKKGRDRIPIMASDNEYVVREAAVRKYGLGFMEALNQGMLEIPHMLLASMKSPKVRGAVSRRGYATGGLVAAPEGGAGRQAGELVIINVVDPAEMDRYLSSSRGQNAVLNVLSSRKAAVRKVIT